MLDVVLGVVMLFTSINKSIRVLEHSTGLKRAGPALAASKHDAPVPARPHSRYRYRYCQRQQIALRCPSIPASIGTTCGVRPLRVANMNIRLPLALHAFEPVRSAMKWLAPKLDGIVTSVFKNLTRRGCLA